MHQPDTCGTRIKIQAHRERHPAPVRPPAALSAWSACCPMTPCYPNHRAHRTCLLHLYRFNCAFEGLFHCGLQTSCLAPPFTEHDQSPTAAHLTGTVAELLDQFVACAAQTAAHN